MKINTCIFFFYAEYYRVVWTTCINSLWTVYFEMLPLSGNNQNIKMFGVPPEHFPIGYVHNDNLPLGNLHYNMSFKTFCRKVWWCFLMNSCTFWRSRFFLLQIYQNYLVALTLMSFCHKAKPHTFKSTRSHLHDRSSTESISS